MKYLSSPPLPPSLSQRSVQAEPSAWLHVATPEVEAAHVPLILYGDAQARTKEGHQKSIDEILHEQRMKSEETTKPSSSGAGSGGGGGADLDFSKSDFATRGRVPFFASGEARPELVRRFVLSLVEVAYHGAARGLAIVRKALSNYPELIPTRDETTWESGNESWEGWGWGISWFHG